MPYQPISIPNRHEAAREQRRTVTSSPEHSQDTIYTRRRSGSADPVETTRLTDTANGVGRPFLNVLQQKPVLAVFQINRPAADANTAHAAAGQAGKEMSRSEIRRVFAALHEEGVRFVFLQGGEPTLRRDLLGIMRDLHDTGFVQTLVSNGARMTTAFVRSLRELPVNVCITLDTLDRWRYRRLRGNDQFKRVLAAVNRLRDYPHPKYLTSIGCEENRDELPAVARFARENGFAPVIAPYHWNVGRCGQEEFGVQYDKQAMAALFDELLDSGLIPPGYLSGYVRENINWLRGKPLGRCDAGRYSIAVDASGNVAPCSAQARAGNLLDSSLDEILANMDREMVRRCSDNSGCNLICNRIIGANLRHPLRALQTPDLLRTFSR